MNLKKLKIENVNFGIRKIISSFLKKQGRGSGRKFFFAINMDEWAGKYNLQIFLILKVKKMKKRDWIKNKIKGYEEMTDAERRSLQRDKINPDYTNEELESIKKSLT